MLPKRIKDCAVTDIQKDNPELFDAIKALGKDDELIGRLNAENSALKAELEGVKAQNIRKEKITNFAKKLGLDAKGEELVASDVSVEDAYETLVNTEKPQVEATNNLNVFEATAPVPAGQASDASDKEVKNFNDAVELIRARDNCSKADATKKAVSEYSQLHQATFNKPKEI